MRPWLALLVLPLLLGPGARAVAPPAPLVASPAAPSPSSPWETGNRITLEVTQARLAGRASYAFEIAANGEFRVEVKEVGEGGASGRSGTVLMIAGRAMATQGVELPAGSEIDAVDRPTLELLLVRTLLDRAVPGGPGAVQGSVPVEIRETNQPLHVSTLTASGEYQPPWNVSGLVRREAADRLAFDFTLHATAEAPGTPGPEIRFAGTWELGTPLPHLPDDLPLAGWNTYTLGPIHHTLGTTEIFAYGAVPVPNRFATVGALRKRIEADAPVQ